MITSSASHHNYPVFSRILLLPPRRRLPQLREAERHPPGGSHRLTAAAGAGGDGGSAQEAMAAGRRRGRGGRWVSAVRLQERRRPCDSASHTRKLCRCRRRSSPPAHAENTQDAPINACRLLTELIAMGSPASETSPGGADGELGEHVCRELELLVDQPIGPLGQPPRHQTPRPSRAGGVTVPRGRTSWSSSGRARCRGGHPTTCPRRRHRGP